MTQSDATPTTAPNLTVLWFSDRGFVEDLIHLRTGSRFDHVAVVLDGVFYECAGGIGVHKVMDPREVAGLINVAAAHKDYTVGAEDLAVATDWAESTLGQHYSDLELLGDALGVDFARPDTGVCSYFVAMVLCVAHVYESPDPRHETPGSIALVLGAA